MYKAFSSHAATVQHWCDDMVMAKLHISEHIMTLQPRRCHCTTLMRWYCNSHDTYQRTQCCEDWSPTLHCTKLIRWYCSGLSYNYHCLYNCENRYKAFRSEAATAQHWCDDMVMAKLHISEHIILWGQVQSLQPGAATAQHWCDEMVMAKLHMSAHILPWGQKQSLQSWYCYSLHWWDDIVVA